MFKLVAIVLFVFLSVSSLVAGEDDYSRLQMALDALGVSGKIPESFKDLVNAKGNDDHYCCKIDMPVIALDQTRLISYQYIQSESYHCGYSSCGLFGWSSCSKYCIRYWIETAYHTDVYTVYQNQQCPQNMIMCCTDYLFVLGHCMHISDIAGNLPLIQQLQAEGIVIPGITGK